MNWVCLRLSALAAMAALTWAPVYLSLVDCAVRLVIVIRVPANTC